eukprot:4267453-Pleurochrysis_carterae.AAC.1
MTLDCKPVRGNDTGVGVSVGGRRVVGLSTLLPPVALAGGLPPEANAVRAQRRQANGRSAHANSAKARAVQAPAPLAAGGWTTALCCARHTRRPWHGSGVHGRGGSRRAAASIPGVLASVGCAGLAGSSAQNAVAAPLVSR